MPGRPMLLHRMARVRHFDCFVKIWATCMNFLGEWFTAPPGRKLPVRLCKGANNSETVGHKDLRLGQIV